MTTQYQYKNLSDIPNLQYLTDYDVNAPDAFNPTNFFQKIGLSGNEFDIGSFAKNNGISLDFSKGINWQNLDNQTQGKLLTQKLVDAAKASAQKRAQDLTTARESGQEVDWTNTPQNSPNMFPTDTLNNSPVSNQMAAISQPTPSTPPTPTTPQATTPIAGQIGAISNNGVGNSISGSQYAPQIPQEQQRQVLRVDPNNITGYQNLNSIS